MFDCQFSPFCEQAHKNLDNIEKLLRFYKLNHIISSHVPFIPMTFAGFE